METVSYEKVEATVQILRDIIVALTENANGKKMQDTLEEKDKQLTEERAARSELEDVIRKQEADAVYRSSEFRYFFYVMNIMSRLAHEEKAKKTEQVVYDFADVTRYEMSTQKKISTLGEELNYMEALLRIQKAWVGDKLDFTVSVPAGYWGIPCPFMLLRQILDHIVDGLGEEPAYPFKLELYGQEDEDAFQLQIRCDGAVQSSDEWVHLLSASKAGSERSLHTINSGLQHVFGSKYGLSVSAREDKQTGVIIRIRLPLEKRGPF